MNLTITNDMIINYVHSDVTYPLNNLILRQNGVDNVVYTKPQPHDYSQDYFTIENIDTTSTTLALYTNQRTQTIYYSTNDGQTWTTKNVAAAYGYYGDYIYISAGQKMIFKTNYYNTSIQSGTTNYQLRFKLTQGKCKIYGNLASLNTNPTLSPYDFTQTTSPTHFSSFFYGSTALVDASNLIMHQSLIMGCYEYMFQGCTALEKAPALPATTLTDYCYQYMFNGCTSLTTAPALPATNLIQYCYRNMFGGCTNLTEITCLAVKKSATQCLDNWVNGVAASGTFYKNSSASWSAGTSGYPSGWTVKNYVA